METKPLQKTLEPATIYLGQGRWVIVDKDSLPQLCKYYWRAVQAARLWYAKTTVGKEPNRITISMHRLIARTPRSQVCHHINRNSLDNRRCNLRNMDPLSHDLYHRMNNLIIQFEQKKPRHLQTVSQRNVPSTSKNQRKPA